MTPLSGNFTNLHEASGPISPAGGHVREMFVILPAIAGLLLCSDSILILSGWCRSLLAFTAFTVVVVRSSGAGGKLRRLVCVALHLTGMYVALRLDGTLIRTIAVSWLLLSLEFSRHRPQVEAGPSGESDGLAQVHWAGLAYACFLLCHERIDEVWFALRGVGELLPGQTPLGLWVSGFQVYLMGFLVVLAGLVTGSRWLRVLAGGTVMLGAFVAGGMLLSAMAPVTHADVSALHGVAAIVVALTVSRMGLRRPGPARVALVSAALTACLLIAGVRPLRVKDPDRCVPGSTGSAGLYSEGLLDWRVPDMEKLGLANCGMFGLFKEELARRTRSRSGCVITADSISEDLLSSVDLLIFINPSRQPRPEEIARIERFVRAGNAILVLGDHTDIGDSRKPLNTILGFTRMQFNYDSAVPLRGSWQGCLEVRSHPVTRHLAEGIMAQVGVGASLRIERPAVALLVARYGFSDAGDSTNYGRGGYMGDITHEGDEQVGDLVLAACEVVGRGRVMVFGDTSPFQNGALFLSRGLVQDALSWLLTRNIRKPPAAASSLPSLPSPAPRDEACKSSRLCCGVGVPRGMSTYGCAAAGSRQATVDFSLKPDASLEPFTDRSLGGLANTLARADVVAVPALSRDDWDGKAPYLFIINPTDMIGDSEKKWLLGYMASGGNVILAKGYADPQPVEPLTSELGFDILPIPLGAGDDTSALMHKEAWAISYVDTGCVEVHSRAFGYPTTVSCSVGSGSFTLIADGRLLLDENLESELRGNPVNIRFVTGLVERLRETTKHAPAD